MTKDSDIEKKKTPLHLAALDLASIMQEIDDVDDAKISDVLIKTLGAIKAELSHSVDRNILFTKFLEHSISSAKELRDAWDHRKKVLENIQAQHKAYLLSALTTDESVKFRGIQGELKISMNPPAMELDIPLERVSYEIISEKNIVDFDVPQELLIHNVPTFSLNKEKLKDVLRDGGIVPFARLRRGKRVAVKI